jgi:hypothetical protein
MRRVPASLLSMVALTLASFAPAAENAPKVLAAGEWSPPASAKDGYAIRGRLVLCEKPRADDLREVVVYVELQDACDFVGHGMLVFCEMHKHDFRPEYHGGLNCELRDKDGQPVKSEPFPFGGGVPRSEWISLPVDGTIRVRATPFGIRREGGIAICPHLGALWIIPNDDPNEYTLSGRFTSEPTAEQTALLDEQVGPLGNRRAWLGTIELPALKVTSKRP